MKKIYLGEVMLQLRQGRLQEVDQNGCNNLEQMFSKVAERLTVHI